MSRDSVKVNLTTLEATYAVDVVGPVWDFMHIERLYMYMTPATYCRLMLGHKVALPVPAGYEPTDQEIASGNADYSRNRHFQRNAYRLAALIAFDRHHRRLPFRKDGDNAIAKRIGECLGGMKDWADAIRLFEFP